MKIIKNQPNPKILKKNSGSKSMDVSRETLISYLQKGGEIEAPRCTRGLKMMAKGSLGQKVLIWGPQNVGKTITKGARRPARSD